MLTLSSFLNHFASIEHTYDGWLATCPSHTDSHRSLRISVSDTGKVLVRDRAGCPTETVLAAVGLTMRDLATMAAGVQPDRPATSTALPATPAAVAQLAVRLDGYAAAMETPEAQGARDYAYARFGIDAQHTAERLGLGYTDDLGGGPRLVVPFRDQRGVARNFQARALEKDAAVRWIGPKSPEGGSWSKLGWFPGGSGWPEVLVCEGPGDALTGAAAGYDTIGIAGASHAGNPAIVDEVAAMIGDREAVIAGDGDPAGRRFSATLADGLAARDVRVRVLQLADGLDLTDWRAADTAGFARNVIRAIAEARPVQSKQAGLLQWDEERYSLTDLGGARYLRDYVEGLGSGVRFAEETGFYLLDGGVWRLGGRQAIRTYAQDVADILKDLALQARDLAAADGATRDDRARAGRLTAYAKHAQTTRGLDAMLRELQAVKGVPASLDEFDRHPDLLAVRNGVINLRTSELQPHDAELLLTRRIEHDYDPAAKAPRWEEFLAQVFPAYPDLPGYVQRLTGYGITGHVTEQCFVVHWGGGGNGKSVFTDTLSEVFREQTVTTPFSTFEDRPSGGIPNDLAALKGARLVMASEGEQGRRMAEAVLKRVTGRDLISARFMRKEFFEFRPTFLLMLATNAKPNFRGQDEGLWRRVKFVPWERRFAPAERDHRLPEKLLAEAPGILAWAVAGARDWYARGLQDPAVVVDSVRDYREESDVLQGFVPGVYVSDPRGTVEGKKVFDDFREYAHENNHQDLAKWSSRAFYGAMSERGYTRRRSTGGRMVIEGIRRARPSDHEPEKESPAISRAGVSDPAHSPGINTSPELPRITGTQLPDF